MLDIRAVAYIAPVSEVDFAPVPLTVRLVNYADETGLVSAGFRVYNDSTGLLIYQSDIIPVEIAKGETVDVSALTDYMPPSPADDTYFVLFDGNAANALVPDGINIHLGSFYFDVKPAPLGPIPAGHAVTHEDTGIDEVDVTGLAGLLADPQTPILHSGTHALPSPDAVYVDFLATLETHTYFRLSPDGTGGVKWNSDVEKHHTNHETGGGDEIDVTDLTGLLTDPQTPAAHDHAGDTISPDVVNAKKLHTENSVAQDWSWYLEDTQYTHGGTRHYPESDGAGGDIVHGGAIHHFDGGTGIPASLNSDHASRLPGIWRYSGGTSQQNAYTAFGSASSAGFNKSIIWVLYIVGNSRVGVLTDAPTAAFDVNSDIIRLRTSKTPATAGASGNAGDICWDADYIYVCVGANTWKRSAIATWV